MKKFTSFLAAATLVVALSSCGSKTAETTETPAADSSAMMATPAADSSAMMAAPADTAAAMAADTTKK